MNNILNNLLHAFNKVQNSEVFFYEFLWLAKSLQWEFMTLDGFDFIIFH